MTSSSPGLRPDAPGRLFYYTSLSGDDRKSWARATIVENRVYFRSRSQLNDPNELRPQFVLRGTEKELRDHVKYLMRHYQKGPRLSAGERLLEEDRLLRLLRRGDDEGHGARVLHEILDRLGVFCLSESGTVPLLWSHYADGHRGVCFEFDASSGLFLNAQPVHYSVEAPVVNRIKDSREAMLDKSMFWKNEHWRYEREWRVIARPEDPERIERYKRQHQVPDGALEFIDSQHGPGDYGLPPEALKAIILGSRISAEDEQFVRLAVADALAPIRIKSAAVQPNGNVVIT